MIFTLYTVTVRCKITKKYEYSNLKDDDLDSLIDSLAPDGCEAKAPIFIE